MEELNKHFDLEELTGKDFQEMVFLLNHNKNLIELSNTWQLFNEKGLFKNLTQYQKNLLIERKDFLKNKFTKLNN